MLQEGLTFDDVLLVPKYSEIESRSEVDISSELWEKQSFKLPIIASPMDTVSEVKMADAMRANGGLAILHRYCSIYEQIAMVDGLGELNRPRAAAIGATGDYLERAQALVEANAQILCLDVAHGHHVLVKRALEALKDKFGDSVHLMAGNIATFEGYCDLIQWGADSVRVGLGGGSICSTRIQTGHGVPNFSALMDIASKRSRDLKTKIPIIIDGGIKNAGDIVKALAAGADFVMVGSLLAGTEETPGEPFLTKEGLVKTYRGMASREAQMDWRARSSSPEGISTVVPCCGPVTPVLEELRGRIKSGFSYSGARTIEELRKNARFIRQSGASMHESSTHILSRYG